jgi:release factor glutamine methyltransferase
MNGESEAPPLVGPQLARAERVLANAGLPAPQDEARSLLGALLDTSTALLLAQPDRGMSSLEVETYATWIARRVAGEALAHITGHLAFMGLDITMGQQSPLPPPDAQHVVETALQWARRRTPGELSAAEISTGCGAIALTLAALEPRFTCVHAVESSLPALEAARANGARYLLNLVINWLEGEGLDAVPEPVDLIVCAQPGWSGLEQTPAKLRPGGALICAVDDVHRPMIDDLLVRTFSGTPIWVEDQQDGPALVVAQLWRDQEGD